MRIAASIVEYRNEIGDVRSKDKLATAGMDMVIYQRGVKHTCKYERHR
jgi:hypothetical protein